MFLVYSTTICRKRLGLLFFEKVLPYEVDNRLTEWAAKFIAYLKVFQDSKRPLRFGSFLVRKRAADRRRRARAAPQPVRAAAEPARRVSLFRRFRDGFQKAFGTGVVSGSDPDEF